MNTTSSPILVALADDHAMLRTSFVAYLNAVKDFQVICEASNGKQLLDAIQASPVKPHICVLDVSMPVMNGYDTLVALKAMLPEVKVLVLTMIDHEGNFLRMIRAGADGYLLKTEEMEELVYAIRFMAEHGYYQNKGQSKSQSSSIRTRPNTSLVKRMRHSCACAQQSFLTKRLPREWMSQKKQSKATEVLCSNGLA